MKSATKTKSNVRLTAPRNGTTSATETDGASPSTGRRIQSILVPIDFSEPSKEALKAAADFARQFGAKLTLLNVVEPVATPDFAYFPLVMENDKVIARCKQELEKLTNGEGIEPGLVEKTLVRNGVPFKEITNAARTLKVDLIVISTHGYTGLAHVFIGSTAERVVRHAHCPVLVVRTQERDLDQNNSNASQRTK